jgi:hypothetical protein
VDFSQRALDFKEITQHGNPHKLRKTQLSFSVVSVLSVVSVFYFGEALKTLRINKKSGDTT